MPGNLKWARYAAGYLVGELGEDGALKVLIVLKNLPDCNRSTKETIERILFFIPQVKGERAP